MLNLLAGSVNLVVHGFNLLDQFACLVTTAFQLVFQFCKLLLSLSNT